MGNRFRPCAPTRANSPLRRSVPIYTSEAHASDPHLRSSEGPSTGRSVLCEGEEPGRPHQSLLQKWLREEHKIHISIYPNADNEGDEPIKWYFSYCSRYDNALHDDAFNCCSDKSFNSYEDAMEQALLQTLDLIDND